MAMLQPQQTSISNHSFSFVKVLIMNLFYLFYFLYPAGLWKAIPDSQSFLFTLVYPFGNEPFKMAPKPGAAGSAGIRCLSTFGPTFGDSRNYDFLVKTRVSAGYISYFNLGHGFTLPENINRDNYFTKGNPLEVSELEVFKVNL